MLATAERCTILVVEDHADTAGMLTRHLGRRGLCAETVGTGPEALEYLAQTKPCCIVLDEGMPGMSGLEFFRHLLAWSETRDIPVFFYSASFDWRKQMEATALGAKGWFVKGVSRMQDLLDAVEACCGAE
jgi:CheY-like chemotaxis protein